MSTKRDAAGVTFVDMTATLHGNAWADWLPQLESLIEGEPSRVANLANLAAALYAMNSENAWHWVGFYLVDEKRDELVLGPFQGPVACTRLRRDMGVCARAWTRGETVLVPDVEEFPGHVACSATSRSELVVPVLSNGLVVAVLDVDSAVLDGFSGDDVTGLEAVAKRIGKDWKSWE